MGRSLSRPLEKKKQTDTASDGSTMIARIEADPFLYQEGSHLDIQRRKKLKLRLGNLLLFFYACFLFLYS